MIELLLRFSHHALSLLRFLSPTILGLILHVLLSLLGKPRALMPIKLFRGLSLSVQLLRLLLAGGRFRRVLILVGLG